MVSMVKRGFVAAGLALWGLSAWSEAQAPAPVPATAETVTQAEATPVIKRLNQVLLEAMRRGKALGYQGRYHLLAPVLREIYDFRTISRYVLGSHWKQLSETQRQQMIDRMSRYGIAAYAAQFDEYNGETFRIVEEKPFRERFRLVKAVLEVPDGDDVEFTYVLRRTKDGWKIIDVRYDGVSDLALKRSQFAKILQEEGFEALLAKLDEKIADYAKEKKAQG
ncbi:phospholipid transport system substrate-binding protein [Methylomarinovum caldicuralii]|uniref:Phospholipid transport system substrate-binding protein n=1 Tax=Methylomarinovum caldicuralii TaxID=438856 RepID=A0AAU9BYY4_9GAMM|nr:ABC transporter substrate-binding protein [Methylomarinovum caldicuralii]BCX81535.1 phospholipid transport system substrate-binding protein [Methylomarinovum caldicuralii]